MRKEVFEEGLKEALLLRKVLEEKKKERLHLLALSICLTLRPVHFWAVLGKPCPRSPGTIFYLSVDILGSSGPLWVLSAWAWECELLQFSLWPEIEGPAAGSVDSSEAWDSQQWWPMRYHRWQWKALQWATCQSLGDKCEWGNLAWIRRL